MRSFSGTSLAVAALVALSVLPGCAKVGQLKAMKSLKAANAAYKQQDYKAASDLYEETVQADPNQAVAYFYLANSYDQQFKPSKKGEAANDALLVVTVGQVEVRGSGLPDGGREAVVLRQTGGQEARQALAGVSRGGVRGGQAERPRQGRTGRPAHDSARPVRDDELLRAGEDLRGRRGVRRRGADAAEGQGGQAERRGRLQPARRLLQPAGAVREDDRGARAG